MFGSLLRTIQEFAKQTTAMSVSYIEFDNVAISMVKSDKDSVYCILFHDIDDGAPLGNIIANQILRSFLDLHRGKLRGVTNVAQFESFSAKLPDVIKGVFFIICTKLRSERGIHGVILLSADGEAITSGNWDDELAIIANIQSLLSASQELMEQCNDRAILSSFEYLKSSVLALETREGTLLAFCRHSVKRSLLVASITDAAALLNKASQLISNVVS